MVSIAVENTFGEDYTNNELIPILGLEPEFA